MARQSVAECACLVLVGGLIAAGTAGAQVIGDQAPEFSLPSIAGESESLADQRGKIVVLHFGAGW